MSESEAPLFMESEEEEMPLFMEDEDTEITEALTLEQDESKARVSVTFYSDLNNSQNLK
jgi:hypothetical protein